MCVSILEIWIKPACKLTPTPPHVRGEIMGNADSGNYGNLCGFTFRIMWRREAIVVGKWWKLRLFRLTYIFVGTWHLLKSIWSHVLIFQRRCLFLNEFYPNTQFSFSEQQYRYQYSLSNWLISSNPTPRIGLSVRPSVRPSCKYSLGSRIIDMCIIQTCIRVKVRGVYIYVHHTHMHRDQWS